MGSRSLEAVDCPKCHRRVAVSPKAHCFSRHFLLDSAEVCPLSGTSSEGLPRYPFNSYEGVQRGHKAMRQRKYGPPGPTTAVVCPNPECGGHVIAVTNRGRIHKHMTLRGERCSYTDATGLERLPYDKRKAGATTEWFKNTRKRGINDDALLVVKTPQQKRTRRYSPNEGLCPVCRRWQRITIVERLYVHGNSKNEPPCPGSRKEPERTRPIGAWKRRVRKKTSNGET